MVSHFMLESTTRHLSASGEDVPDRSWSRLTAAAEVMAASLFPHGGVALRVTDDAGIRELNRLYRGVDAATDILSFPNSAVGRASVPANGSQAETPAPRGHAGDLALSWETALRQAAVNGNSPEDEAIALVAHGLLHLAGHDHDTDADDARMHAATLELLNLAEIEVSTFGH